MPPKKPPKKDAKKKDDEEEIDYEALCTVLDLQIMGLQKKLVLKQEEIQKSTENEKQLQAELVTLNEKFNDEQQRALAITADMMRQYDTMQSQLLEQISKLETLVSQNKFKLEQEWRSVRDIQQDRIDVINQKDKEIAMLKTKLEDMAHEFADMLKDTLTKMTQRIELNNNQWDAGATAQPLMKRLEEFNLSASMKAADEMK
eukprot:GILI01013686.1.p1 GENE.GILI01013686.1~~GILI01013686.1.p1  ORF type:complete len:202 (-),score=63.82 GILI01013686.1:28-633(-)